MLMEDIGFVLGRHPHVRHPVILNVWLEKAGLGLVSDVGGGECEGSC